MRKRGLLAGLAAAALSAAAGSPEIVAAFGKTRSLALYNIHSKDTVDVVYKRDGKYVPEAMEKLNWALRDWRKNEPAKMDPELIDLLWEIHTELGSKQPIHIISGFRSRDTNEMLRKTVGGQASESQHIQGKAADVHFPDVPLKQLRYSALIRERGGVGYYPTSAIPFVHVDTARVRHWPRLPRYELALLFPDGQSKHQPVDGGPITREDVKIAQARHKDLAVQVAEFFNFRSQPKGTTQVADASGKTVPSLAQQPNPQPKAAPVPFAVASAAPPVVQAAREPVVRTVPPPVPVAEQKVAALNQLVPQPTLRPQPAVAAPQLVVEPKLVERPSRFTPRPTDQDRSRLDELVTLASFTPEASGPPAPQPRQAAEPKPVERPARAPAFASLSGGAMPLPQFMKPDAAPTGAMPRVAALTPEPGAILQERLTDALLTGWGNGFTTAPEFDEEHPDELSYRPFAVAPLLTNSASADDPVLAQLTAPDAARTLELLDSEGQILPMRFRPGVQTAQIMWAQQFKGSAVNVGARDAVWNSGIAAGETGAPANAPPLGLNNRPVKTLPK